MKKLFVATNNSHKLEEISAILKEFNLDIELVSPNTMNCNIEPIEDGLSFEDNAIIKAKFYYDLFHLPTIADDSGIKIKYLNNNPGVHSARFLQDLNYHDRNEYILKLMKNVQNRKASFHCVLAYIDEYGNTKTYEGTINGTIATSQRGTNGFGYDPIFCYGDNNMTNAELPKGAKNEFSHRYLVLKKWVKDVKNQ